MQFSNDFFDVMAGKPLEKGINLSHKFVVNCYCGIISQLIRLFNIKIKTLKTLLSFVYEMKMKRKY